MRDDYAALLARKAVRAPMRGMKSPPDLAAHLYPFQADTVRFGLQAGSFGCYLGTGLGKTLIELEWCRHAGAASNGRSLILTPLAVARQIEAEGHRFGYPDAHVIREQSQARDGINICNYDRIDKLDLESFGAVAADESSAVKAMDGALSRALTYGLRGHRWRMGASATPAPNDHMELGQQSELLGIMPSSEMLMRWFKNDTSTASQHWRLKGHAVADFWRWMASWSRAAEHPRDLGDNVAGFDLLPLNIIRHLAPTEPLKPEDGSLFAGTLMSATSMHDVKRQTIAGRAEMAAEVVDRERSEPWVIWCDTNYEADALLAAMPWDDVADVRGSQSIDQKEEALAAFADGSLRVLISKPSVTGYGLNWQHCARTLFVGRSFSYEAWHQAIRRFWRFGQLRAVDCHLVVAEGEDTISRVIDRKADGHARMLAEMRSAMAEAVRANAAVRAVPYNPTHIGSLPWWGLGNGADQKTSSR